MVVALNSVRLCYDMQVTLYCIYLTGAVAHLNWLKLMTGSDCFLQDTVLLIVVQHLEAGPKLQYTGSMQMGKVQHFYY